MLTKKYYNKRGMKSIFYHRIKNWMLDHKEWLLCLLGVGLLLVLAFQAGYVLGRHELSPIIIEQNRENISP